MRIPPIQENRNPCLREPFESLFLALSVRTRYTDALGTGAIVARERLLGGWLENLSVNGDFLCHLFKKGNEEEETYQDTSGGYSWDQSQEEGLHCWMQSLDPSTPVWEPTWS